MKSGRCIYLGAGGEQELVNLGVERDHEKQGTAISGKEDYPSVRMGGKEARKLIREGH